MNQQISSRLRVVGYVRVSSLDQAFEGISLGMQIEKIKAYAALNEMLLVDIKQDAAISAKNIHGRPGFQDALSMVMGRHADALLVWKLDRAFRSTKDALSIAEKLNKRGKGLHSITEKLDTSSAIGEFFFTLMASLAQMERRLVGERTKAALDTKRERMEKLGGKVPYGYRVEGGQLIEVPEEQAIIVEVKRLRDAGATLRVIQIKLMGRGMVSRSGGELGLSTLHKIIKTSYGEPERVEAEAVAIEIA